MRLKLWLGFKYFSIFEMTENQKKSNRQYAAFLARKFFNGQLSKYNIVDSFPNFENDLKIRLLYNRIMEKPKKSWFFGISKKKYQKFLEETYEIIEDLETDGLNFKTMKSLFHQFWLQSNNGSEPIENMGFQIFEVSRITNNYKNEVIRYLDFLVEKNYIQRIADSPLLYEFTESGKKIKSDSDIEDLIKNAP